MFGCYGLARALARTLARAPALVLVLALSAAGALAQEALKEKGPKEPLAILQLGGGVDWGLNGGVPGFGPSVAVEFTPIRNWLEVETGVATSFSKGRTEVDWDFVFKKPFDLSPYVEFEPGLGPVWIRTVEAGRTSNALGATAVFEFMIWPTLERKYGWFVEPSYTYSFARGHDQSFGISGGLLIPIR